MNGSERRLIITAVQLAMDALESDSDLEHRREAFSRLQDLFDLGAPLYPVDRAEPLNVAVQRDRSSPKRSGSFLSRWERVIREAKR